MHWSKLDWPQRSYGYGYSSLFYGVGGGQYGGDYLENGTGREPSRRFVSDETLQLEIAAALARISELDVAALQVLVCEGCVTLRGVVSNRDVLEQITSLILGMDDVKELTLEDLLIFPLTDEQRDSSPCPG